MSSYPNFSSYGYTISRELGHNLTGGRVTYLATENKTSQPVVIKQFQFAQATGNWRSYDAIYREIEVLQRLNHPSIPRYLTSFETSSGFCLVQEYKQAASLASSSQFTPLEIQKIAIAVLEVLVYLQQQNPPIIHRDIKPENILVARDINLGVLKVYVVDFGFARLGEGDFASSVVKGTLAFMPPEQIRNRQLTQASDLYGLGATLICLLTGTKSENVGDLIDENYRINFVGKVQSKLSRSFIRWLQKMVEPKLSDRFANAEVALKSLKLDKIAAKKVINFPRYTFKFLKIFTLGLLTVCSLILVMYEGKKWVAHQRLVAKQQLLLVEQKQKKELEQKGLIKKLQATKACVGCNLEGANLAGLLLDNVNLKGANLKGANLEQTKLKGANLEETNLEGATLNMADLEKAILKMAKLENANLAFSNLKKANLKNANLKNVNLENADFYEDQTYSYDGKDNRANLEEANLENANLVSANLENANLKNAKFNENISSADESKAKLGANLRRANLEGANLENADLRESSLFGANLDGANTVNAKFNGAFR